jgi:polyhydroxyalkanoate synthesis regulator phasin
MFDILKESVFVSLGLASLARDKAEELVTEVSRRAKLSEADATKFREELMRRQEAAQKDLQAEIDRRIDHAFIQLGILKGTAKKSAEAARDEVQSFLDRRIDKAIERLEVARAEDVQSLLSRVEMLERKTAKV